MNKFALGVALTALAAAGTAYALEGPDGPRPMWDADGDGVVERADAEHRAGAMFDRLDVNRDGKLDAADRAAHDAQMFDRIDADHNGQISRDEFTAFHARRPGGEDGPRPMAMGDAPQGGPDGPGGPGGRHMRGHHGPQGGGMMMMRMADGDGNGSVSRAEFIAAGLKRFDAADTSRDGKLSAAERQAARGPMVMEMRKRWQARSTGAEPAPTSPAPSTAR